MQKPHYSWAVCLAGMLLAVCTIGVHGNVFSVYLPYIEALGFSGAQCSSLLSLRCLFTLGAMLLIRLYYDLFSLRTGLCIAALLSALGNILFSIAESMPLLGIAAAVSGLAYGFGSMIPLSVLMHRWFCSRQALAISVCATGSGLSTICFPPVIAVLIRRFGLTTAFQAEALLIAICAVVAWLVIRDNPENLSLSAYGYDVCGTKAENVFGNYQIPRHSFFSMIVVMLLLGGVTTAAIGHVTVLLTTNGYAATFVSALVSLFGVALTAGKFAFGWISDRCGAKLAGALSLCLLALGCFTCCFCPEQHCALACSGVLLLGFGYPVASLGSSVWAADFSTEDKYADTLRWFQTAYQTGGILFSSIPGVIYDMTGSYRSSFAVFCVLSVIMLLVVDMVYREKRHILHNKGGRKCIRSL